MAAAQDRQDRIVFPGNPWPAGHRITEFDWTGWFESDIGLSFGFSLETVDYDSEHPPDLSHVDPESGFGSPVVWRNYHACDITTNRGFVVGTSTEPLDFYALTARTFHVDPELPPDPDEHAFHIYLLGHDSVADHHIRFPERHGPMEFSVRWDGRIALTYIGSYDCDHEFHASVGRAVFQGFKVSSEFNDADDETVVREMNRCLTGPARFRLVHQKGTRHLVPL